MSPRLEFAAQTAYEAGRQTLALFQNAPPVEVKGDDTPVTQADRDAERLIRSRLAATYPGEAIYGEEEGETGSGGNRWLIDPIDGTKSFICGVPLYATLLSFERDGIPEVGIAYFPALDWMLCAERGQGATANGRAIRVSQVTDWKEATICTAGITGLTKRGWLDAMSKLSLEVRAMRTWCDAYGHCLVASGQVEAMLDPVLHPYDISAVSLIIEEAGGKCTTLKNESYPRTEGISSNGHLHPSLLERLI